MCDDFFYICINKIFHVTHTHNHVKFYISEISQSIIGLIYLLNFNYGHLNQRRPAALSVKIDITSKMSVIRLNFTQLHYSLHNKI